MDGKIVHLTDLNQFSFSEKKKEILSLARKYQDSSTVPLQPLYTEFVLYMENQETLDAKSILFKIAKKNKYDYDMVIVFHGGVSLCVITRVFLSYYIG
jgi:hypothetical protein